MILFRVIEPSEHDGATYRILGATQVECVGENEPVKKKPPLRRRITERPIPCISSDAEFYSESEYEVYKILRPRILEKIDI